MSNWSDMKIDQWFFDRSIVKNGTPMGQAIKTLEETTELIDAINLGDEALIKDAVGDVYVTLRGVCLTAGINFDDCVQQAYSDIEDRTGHLRKDGVFVKDDEY